MKIISSEREDDLTIFFEQQASLPSAAQPAVMDIRRNLQVFRNVNFFTYIKKTAKNSYCLHNCLREQRIVCIFASSKG